MLSESLRSKMVLIIGSALGLGLSPIMPGTCGALLGVGIHLVIMYVLPATQHLKSLTLIFTAVCAANYFLTPWAEAYWKSPDPSHFVLDEVAGYLFVPILFREGDPWKVALWGFILFRILDIFKIMPPAQLIDRELHGPWGILLDDLVSAAWAAFFMYGIYWFGPEDWL